MTQPRMTFYGVYFSALATVATVWAGSIKDVKHVVLFMVLWLACVDFRILTCKWTLIPICPHSSSSSSSLSIASNKLISYDIEKLMQGCRPTPRHCCHSISTTWEETGLKLRSVVALVVILGSITISLLMEIWTINGLGIIRPWAGRISLGQSCPYIFLLLRLGPWETCIRCESLSLECHFQSSSRFTISAPIEQCHNPYNTWGLTIIIAHYGDF